MKITLNNIEDISEETTTFEKFKSRKRKLTPGKRNVNQLVTAGLNGSVFNRADLEELRDKGILDEIICIIKSGKEASVYLGKVLNEYMAVKIYTDLRVRSFRKDDIYRQGRFVGDARMEKAIDQGSEKGLDAHQILWVQEEFRQMKFLYDAGIPVPKPIAISGLVILMEFIGTDQEASERLSDCDLDKEEAEDAFRQSLKILDSIVTAGRIHGDFSAFNILWHNGKAVVIDFPQIVSIERNSSAKELLYRDINSLCKSFKRFKIDADPERIFSRLVRKIDF
ncbi:MAG TPA: RIO1 family regulatory kinase/ATPase [Ignavibacteria bacterium]|nr:RIO1 family regulatory kinase/ATPase [Ignavibacteria bacterium]